jgi:hypothetical protein
MNNGGRSDEAISGIAVKAFEFAGADRDFTRER